MCNKPQNDNQYRIFVGIFPKGTVIDRIQELRQRYDPKTASRTDPHITLAGTYWRSGAATVENEAAVIARLDALRMSIAAFDLIVGGIETFSPLSRVIYLKVHPNDALLLARQTVLGVLGVDRYRTFKPHLTLTMRLSLPKTRSLLSKLRETAWHTGRWTFHIDALWLMQRGAADPAWRYIHQIPLSSIAV